MILTIAMAHQRKLIRQAVVALLISANTAAAGRVKGTRIEPLKSSKLPYVAVYCLDEPVDPDSHERAPREYKRELTLEVVGWVAHKDSAPADDAMDDLAEQIENAMDADRWLGGTAGDSYLTNTTMQLVEGDGHSDPTVGIVALTYTVVYRTSPAANDGQPTDDLETIDAKYELALAAPIVAVDPATDRITITGHGLATGAGPGIIESDDTLPDGLTELREFWIIRIDANTVQLAASSADALAHPPVPVDITSAGSGDLTLRVAMPQDTFTVESA